MDDNTPLNVVQKQATVGELITDYIAGEGITAIAEKYGLAPEKVRDVIQQADREGKLIPPGAEVPIDKVSDTPEPLVEGKNPEAEKATTENPAPGTGATYEPKATTKNQP